MRIEADNSKIYALRLTQLDDNYEESFVDIMLEKTGNVGTWVKKEVPHNRQIIGILCSTEDSPVIKRVGFVLSQSIPKRGS